jgi:hypothetical protein
MYLSIPFDPRCTHAGLEIVQFVFLVELGSMMKPVNTLE